MTDVMRVGESTMPMSARRSPQPSRTVLHLVGLLLAAAMVSLSLAACAGDSSTPTAHDVLCTNMSNLQNSVQDLLTVKKGEDLTAFKTQWNQVKTDFNSVKTSAQQVGGENIQPVITSFNALVTAVQSALSAPSVSAAVSNIQTSASSFKDSLNTAVSNLKCSS